MDSFEDVSARVLLRNVLYTEPPRSPVTRSMSTRLRPKRSTQLRKSDAGLLSPQVALRQKLRKNLHKNISNGSPLQNRSSLPMSTTKTSAVTSSHSLSEDDVTPRVLLRRILWTEPEMSLLVPHRPDSEETEPRSTESSPCSNRPSMGISNMSNLELPDLPTVNLTMAVGGISRKRPKRNINLSVFERKIIDQSEDGSGEGEQDATGNLSTMSGVSASSLNLSLKTPRVDLHTDRPVLQRNAGKRKAISVEDFEAGVHDLLAKKRNPDREQVLSETAGMEKFTLGLSDATASNISSIAMSNTALYPPPISTPPVSTPHAYIAIHDRDTATASQIQREVQGEGGGWVGGRMQDEVVEEEVKMEQEEVGGDAPGGEGRKNRRTGSRMGVEEGRAGEQGYEEKEPEKMKDEDIGDVLDKMDKEGPEGSAREEGDEVEGGEEAFGDTDVEMENADLQVEEEEGSVEEAETIESEKEEESEGEVEEQGAESEEKEEAAAKSEMQEDEVVESERVEWELEDERDMFESNIKEGGATESETQEEEVSSGQEQVRVAEHILRRTYRSEGVMKIPRMAPGGRVYKSLSSSLQPMDTGEALESTGTQEGGGATEYETQEEEVSSVRVPEHISRRTYRSEGVMKIPGMAAGGRGYKSLSSGLQPMDIGSGEARESTGTQEGGGATEYETQEEEVSLERVPEHISRRTYRSEGVMKIPGMAAGGRGYKSLSSGLQPMDMGEALKSTGTQEEGGATESETQEEEVSLERVPEHISRRTYRSEGVMKIPGMVAGGRGYKSLSSGLQPMDMGSGEALESTGTQEEGGATESETQEEEVSLERAPEHISRRTYRSEGVMKIPGMAAGGRGYKSLSSGLQPMDMELESGEGQVEPVMSSEGRASSEWHSGPEEGSLATGDSPPHSPQASSPVSSPNEIPPSQEPLHSSRGRKLLEEEEEEEEEEEDDENEEENMSGVDYAEVVEDKENSIPLAQPVSPEMSLLCPHTSTRAEPNAAMGAEREPEPSEDEGEEEEDDPSESDELSLATPAFVRKKKRVLTPGPVATPNFLKQMMEARKPTQAAAPAAKPKPQRKGRAAPSQKEPGLPKSYVMTTFKHFAKTTVSSECYPILKDIMAKYFDRLADDLEAYATHAKRKTIEVEDVELLMRRQGFVTDSMPVNVLIEKYLPHEYRKLLIPVATSGNKIIPKKKR